MSQHYVIFNMTNSGCNVYHFEATTREGVALVEKVVELRDEMHGDYEQALFTLLSISTADIEGADAAYIAKKYFRGVDPMEGFGCLSRLDNPTVELRDLDKYSPRARYFD